MEKKKHKRDKKEAKKWRMIQRNLKFDATSRNKLLKDRIIALFNEGKGCTLIKIGPNFEVVNDFLKGNAGHSATGCIIFDVDNMDVEMEVCWKIVNVEFELRRVQTKVLTNKFG